jgi:hypothetical protein
MKKYLPILFGLTLFLFGLSTELFAQVTFGTGPLYIRVDAYGAIRIFTVEGTDTLQHINRISVLAAGNLYEVMDYWSDLEVEIETQLVANPTLSDYEVFGAYNNEYSQDPPNFFFEQTVYGWNDQPYIIGKCNITNREYTEMPMQPGLDVVQYVDYTWEDDKIFYDAVNQVLTQFENHHIGIKTLSEQTTSAQVFEWYDGYELLDTNYYNMMNEGTFDIDTLVTDADGGVGILGGEHTTLQSSAFKSFYFAVAVGSTGSEMLANMEEAIQKYYSITSVQADHNSIPEGFVLEQNYPNPFNPATAIKFGIPAGSNVTLKIFNTLGEEVAEIVNNYLDAGTYTFNFDASQLPSGIYVYTLQTTDQLISKKMTLIK